MKLLEEEEDQDHTTGEKEEAELEEWDFTGLGDLTENS